ncbi:uncharacterized protein LOC120418266 [Culex pipiens pallens]|uniref:uncharacterized protein LOC120418266 n=1 Tax=Culex pipiens pallens TaxID=42434 RepID=UPI0019541301|nr:uncharacterized protein LOC120418266 [Culex pipiens pallens]XP_039436518.1 uncharacterized protein LOC120418266 [Culex pipiens pallens]XP_039436519.1 uncharacterized protein LOC120418266 [Culex pipiens pallens]XP_052565259.1 uncharacterized protein LOC120418266 [Culex pipiens pallens]
MATREKKPRSVNSDSPTPSLGGSDSAPSTPTSKGKGATNTSAGSMGNTGSGSGSGSSRASLSRQKSKQLLQNASEDTAVQSGAAATDDVTDAAPSTTNRTTRATKDDSGEQSSKEKSTAADPKDSPKDSKPAASTARKGAAGKKKPIRGGGRGTAKTTITALKKTTLIKRKTRPIVGKPVLGKKVLARKQMNAKGKKEVTVTVKEQEDNKNTSLRNGKPRATDSPVSQKSRKTVVTPKDKSPKDATSSTPEPTSAIKLERRRSDSVSKCSDVTDASSMLETSTKDNEDDKKDDTSLSEIKREIMEEQETKSKILDKMAETFNERKTPIAAVVGKDEKTVRRSARQRKSTARDRDDFVTPKLKVPAEIKAEPVDADETTAAATAAPLSIDTTESPTGTKESTVPSEKDASLSPELVSEGVSEISVKEFYSEPAFLENNLGIEQDPKLGEIVQVQEKIKLDKGGSESEVVATAANGSEEPPAASETVEPAIVVVKEEKMEVEEEVPTKDDTVKASEPMEVDKVKEIIGAVVESPPVAKEETSGNESPASDWSNEKDTTTSSTLGGKVKKNDSRSDSDGERPPSSKQNTPRATAKGGTAAPTAAGATSKEPKPKTRNVKDKSKEDEKAKEEKLRQEKLRVEEKVREEKLRAERLKQEEEKEKKMLESKVADVVEVSAAAPEVDGSDSAGKQDPPNPVEEVVSVVEKVLAPVTVTTTLSLTSADSHLVLSVKSTESIDIVDKPDVAKLNALALENLPAITFVKKEAVKDDAKLDNVQLKAELEIVPIKETTVVVEEIPVEKEPETTLHIISKSESAAAAVTVTTVAAAAAEAIPATPPVSIIKIQTEKDSTNSAVFKENLAEKLEVKAPEAVKNRDSIEKVPPVNETKTAEAVLRVTEVLPAAVAAGSSTVLQESEDIAKQKESHLKHLGLLTHQAASEEKQRRKELQDLQKPGSGGSGYSSSSSSGKGSGGKSSRNSESTGTLKTVIKLNRGEKRKRLPLKMTLQKGKGKGAEKDGANGGDGNGDAFYIIQNETDHQNQSMTDSTGATAQGRKGHHRSHTTDGVNLPEVVTEAVVEKVVQKAPLVIPEKASSFNVHPERLCMDQCFYCGGKFGLYDTPCHIRAMKSTERQQNILASETKIKIDSCLCDACFRHVDRKANCPSYRKKTEAKSLSLAKMQSSLESGADRQSQYESNQKAGESSGTAQQQPSPQKSETGGQELLDQADANVVQGSCHVANCAANACHTIRRKWLVKMKKTICKILEINLDQSNAAMTLIPICDGHYERISHLMVCAMCQRRLPKNHIYYIVNEIPQLERLIQEQGIAIKLGNSTLVVCKLCRYYANLLLKPPDAKSQKAQFIKNYNRRLLQFYERDMEPQEQIVTNPDIIISDGEEDEPLEVVTVNDSISLQRRTRHARKSTDLTIIDTGNCSSQVGDLDEVTITPAPKLLANISGNSSIVLDTDLSFEQPPSAEKRRKNDDGLDMTKALKANPNISMRELFPGEEELGIHINIPFNTAATRTPEGWAKVTTTLQYDDSTRSMWEELQKPYGNQSSFLRHLVLLEKYYRNGDLILSPQAKNNAVTYSEAVQSRLRSFDNVPTPPPVSVIDKSSIMQQQLGNAPITITPAAKTRTKSSTEPVSLLKSNNPHLTGGESSTSSMKRKLSTDGKQKSSSSGSAKTDSKVIKLDETSVGPSNKATNLVPPELISINAKQNVTITTIPANTKPSTAQSTQPQQQSLLQPQQSLLQPQPQVKKSPGPVGTREIIKLPDQLTEAERRETSKPWRPTLIPITPGSAEAIKSGPLYQTADGRRLPKLVQVMSGGKPYHISINDYNRMCILRREKLLQQQQQLFLQQHKRLQQQSPPSLTAIKTTNPKPSENPPKMVQIPNQILEQNSLIPIASNNNNNNSSAKANGPSSELQQLIKTRKPNSNTNSALVPPPLAANAASAFFKSALGGAKPISLPNSTSVFSMPAPNQQPVPGEAPTPPTPSQLDQLIKLNNFVSQSQLSAFVAAAAAANTAPSLLGGGGGGATSGGSILMDSAAAQLLKIPKSLTVIPQQKQRSLSRVSSNEDQSSA